MVMVRRGLRASLAVVASLSLAAADLPIHCTLQDVAGDWTFHFGPATPLSESVPACGHSIPNTVSSMLALNRTAVLPPSNATRLSVTLTENIATKPRRHLKVSGDDAGEDDSWTMVFDTGLEVRIGAQAFVAHFFFEELPNATGGDGDSWNDIGKYIGRSQKNVGLKPPGETYACHCDVTSMGWWHREVPNGGLEGGCMWGAKRGRLAADSSLTKASLPLSVVRLHRSSDRALAASTAPGARGPAQAVNFGVVMYNASAWSAAEESGRMTTFKEVFRLSTAPDPELEDLSNKAAAFERKSTSLRGVRAHRHNDGAASSAHLPAIFDWREVLADMVPKGHDPLGEQIDQGPCGSCYAFAGTMMLQMRFRVRLFQQHGILYPLELSYKSVARCSPYTEGCSGGFSYLTSRLAKEVGVPLSDCDQDLDAAGVDKTCDWRCFKNNTNRFYARDYWNIGGFSHGSDEESIMREIYHNGPVELGFSTTAIPEFVKLNGRSFLPETDVMTMISNHLTPKENYSANGDIHQWWYSTHAILAVGWGEEKVSWGLVKYWIVRNSWGRTWGENGYGKMRRGNNDGGIETDASAVEPDMTRLPRGFLEEARSYRRQETSAGSATAAKRHKGPPDYCKERPDSPDCS
mmetsp:Transcript_40241/g.110654  ORF Transcript_40241/g.110654 Transcript_40241/m.110654 type:complete len:634 (-) Transcript_40241:159-2060(-)